MIQKAIIVGRSETEAHKYRVRIPILHGLSNTPDSTPDEYLPHATVCGNPAVTADFHSGDVVYVAFENDEFDFPVIMGQLIVNTKSANVLKSDTQNNWDLRGTSLNISNNNAKCSAVLPVDTTIGEVNSDEISTLVGVKENIQNQFDTVDGDISNIESDINTINEDISTINGDLTEINDEIDNISQNINNQIINLGGSLGLEFTSTGGGYCALIGLGTCTDTSIRIPTYDPSMQLVTQIRGNVLSGAPEPITALAIPQGVNRIFAGALNYYDRSILFYKGLPDGWYNITKEDGWKGDSRVNMVICADGTQIDV